MEEKLSQENERLAELLQLHNEIVMLDGEIDDRITLRLRNTIRSGELLIEQKRSLKHGEWGPWIKANLPYSQGTAERWMKLYVNKDKIFNLKILRLSEAYAALTDPRERPEDDFETEDEWNSMLEALKKANEAKKKRETTPPFEKKGKGSPLQKPGGSQENKGKEGGAGEGEESKKQDEDEPNDHPYGTPDEEVEFKKGSLLKLAERGQCGDVTINNVVETVNFAGDQKVQDQVNGAREFLLFMEGLNVVEVMEKIKTAFKHLWEMNKHG